MISTLNFSYDLSTATDGYVIGNHEKVKAGDKIPLYIPKIMSSIPKGNELEKSNIGINSARYLYSNAKECLPVTRTILSTRNYIYAIASDNCDYSKGLKNGQRVNVTYPHDSLVEIYLNTMFNTKDSYDNEGAEISSTDVIDAGNAN